MSRRFNVIVLLLACLIHACSMHRAFFDYQEFADKIPIRPDPWQGELIGPVSYDTRGAIWDNCSSLAKTSVWGIIDKTRSIGGNAIGDIRWLPKDGAFAAPHCKKRWGFFAILPFIFTPLFMSATVEANAYKVAATETNNVKAGIYFLPKDDKLLAEVVRRIVAPAD